MRGKPRITFEEESIRSRKWRAEILAMLVILFAYLTCIYYAYVAVRDLTSFFIIVATLEVACITALGEVVPRIVRAISKNQAKER